MAKILSFFVEHEKIETAMIRNHLFQRSNYEDDEKYAQINVYLFNYLV